MTFFVAMKSRNMVFVHFLSHKALKKLVCHCRMVDSPGEASGGFLGAKLASSRKQISISSGVTIFEAHEPSYETRFRSIGLLATRRTGWSATGPDKAMIEPLNNVRRPSRSMAYGKDCAQLLPVIWSMLQAMMRLQLGDSVPAVVSW